METVGQAAAKESGGAAGGSQGGTAMGSEGAERISGILDTYRVPEGESPQASAEVFVVDDDGTGRYLVRPPRLSPREAEALRLLQANLLDSVPAYLTGEPRKLISDHLVEVAEGLGVSEVARESHDKLLYYLTREYHGFWEVDTLMNDENLEEISVSRYDRPVRVLHRGFGQYMFMETDVVYPSEQRLQAFIRRLAQLGGTSVSLAQPALEVTLEGTPERRVTATLGDEISRPGSTYAIRKQARSPITLARLASTERVLWSAGHARSGGFQEEPFDEVPSHRTLSELMAAYFWLLLERTTNVLIAGETNSGKTTLMNAILSLANPRCKVVTAEDVLEISLPDHLHWHRLKTRLFRAGVSPAASRYEYGLHDLLKLALRFSPTIVSLGEMRGEESETVAAAITLGFSTMATVHAENAEKCIQRLTTPPMKFTPGHVRDITAIATMKKVALRDGRMVRRVVSVDEVKPEGKDSYSVLNIFSYDPSNDGFSPTTPAEVLDRSFRLNEIADSMGESASSVQVSLSERAACISSQIRTGDMTPRALSTMVRSFAAVEGARTNV